MKSFIIKNYLIDTPIENILDALKLDVSTGKLKNINISGDDIAVTCPNDEHSGGCEDHPDCHINISDNKPSVPFGQFHCFACGCSGSFVKFVAYSLSTTISGAERWLIGNFGKETAKVYQTSDIILFNRNKKSTESNSDKKYLETLQSWCPYLAHRNLTFETCNKFNVKYDDSSREVVFPCYDEHNKLVMLAKRSIDTKRFHMDKGVEKPLYGINNIVANNIRQVLITEGPFDCLLSNQYGVPAVATLGSVSDEQINKLNKSGINVLYTMFDNDEAGRGFAEKVKRKISNKIIVINIPIPNGYKDIGELSYEKFWEIFNKYKNSNNIIV